VLPLLFNDPLNHFLSRYTPLTYCDKNSPEIIVLKPDINEAFTVDKKTKDFNVSFTDQDSGLDFSKSYLKVSYKEDRGYKALKGKLIHSNSDLSFHVEEDLKYGEYLFEVLLFDETKNKTQFSKPFIIREGNELDHEIAYSQYEKASEKNRVLFNGFLETKKYGAGLDELYIYKIIISNRDDVVILKDIYLSLDIADGGIFFSWEQIGSLYTNDEIKIYGTLAETIDKREGGRVYGSQDFIRIGELGPHGFVSFLVLIGRPKFLPKAEIYQGIDIHGTYSAVGYGVLETRKVDLHIPKSEFKILN
jgi:hypothetical protein